MKLSLRRVMTLGEKHFNDDAGQIRPPLRAKVVLAMLEQMSNPSLDLLRIYDASTQHSSNHSALGVNVRKIEDRVANRGKVSEPIVQEFGLEIRDYLFAGFVVEHGYTLSRRQQMDVVSRSPQKNQRWAQRQGKWPSPARNLRRILSTGHMLSGRSRRAGEGCDDSDSDHRSRVWDVEARHRTESARIDFDHVQAAAHQTTQQLKKEQLLPDRPRDHEAGCW